MTGHKNWLIANPHNPKMNRLKYLGHYPEQSLESTDPSNEKEKKRKTGSGLIL
jgi:hypothetical protein